MVSLKWPGPLRLEAKCEDDPPSMSEFSKLLSMPCFDFSCCFFTCSYSCKSSIRNSVRVRSRLAILDRINTVVLKKFMHDRSTCDIGIICDINKSLRLAEFATNLQLKYDMEE